MILAGPDPDLLPYGLSASFASSWSADFAASAPSDLRLDHVRFADDLGRTYRWRGGLAASGRRMAASIFRLDERQKPWNQQETIRGAVLREDDAWQGRSVIVLDPLDCDDEPRAWQAVACEVPEPEYHRWRIVQVMSNLDRMRVPWALARGQFAGRPGYLVGSGHSARRAAEAILPRARRRGVVLALNSAAGLFPGEMNLWWCHDALWPAGDNAWRARTLGEWAGYDFTGAHGMFSVHTAADVVDLFLERGGVSANFAHGLHRSPYRELVSDVNLPSFVEGMQGAVSAFHALAWLGCDPILLFGVDQAKPIGAAREHYGAVCPLCAQTDGRRVSWRPSSYAHDAYAWIESDGVEGPVDTCTTFLLAAKHLVALSMWYADGGKTVVNCSAGLDLVFAPHVTDYREAVRRAEVGESVRELVLQERKAWQTSDPPERS